MAVIFGIRVRRHDLTQKRIEEICAFGFTHVEWEWSWNGSGHTSVPNSETLKEAIELFKEYKLTCSVAGPNGISIAEKVDPLRQVSISLWQAIYKAAALMRAKWVVLELGSAGCYPNDRATKQKRINIAARAVADILRHSSSNNPFLLIENQRRLPSEWKKCYLGDDARDLNMFLAELNKERVGIMFDTGHALIRSSPNNFLSQIKNHICSIALHANNGMADEHRELKFADINANPAYWYNLASLATQNIPVVIEIDDIKEAVRCKQIFVQLISTI